MINTCNSGRPEKRNQKKKSKKGKRRKKNCRRAQRLETRAFFTLSMPCCKSAAHERNMENEPCLHPGIFDEGDTQRTNDEGFHTERFTQ